MAEDSKLGSTGSSAVEVVPKITKPPRPERPVAHPVIELTTARVVEFMRDPGALFWTFGFPVILAVALGLAFRSGSPVGPRVALNCESGCVQLRTALEQ